jgi:CRISPR/Cas system CSM-associated protein Csm3 (group 7 of RAMP superfamily)
MTALIDPSKPWQRVRIEAALQVLSPMHVGDGHTQTFANRKAGQRLNDDAQKATADTSDYGTVRRGHDGRPMLPGSSLRGLLRAELARIDKARAERLFGPMASGTSLHMGKLVVHDAHLTAAPDKTEHLADYVPHAKSASSPRLGADTCIAHAVSIEAITGAAAEHLLFSDEYVPAGSKFGLSFELGPCDDADIEAVLELLNALDGTHDVNLGGGGSHGFGRFRIDLGKDALKLMACSTSTIAKWLVGSGTTNLEWETLKRALPAPADIGTHRYHRCRVELRFDSAFAVNDPGLVGRSGDDHAPDIEFSRDGNGNPCIPGRSLRGMLRHRATRIVATILHAKHQLAPNDARARAAKLIEDVFGSTGAQSLLRVGEATAPSSPQLPTIERTFNAVDRFTGGVADTKLYTAKLAQATTLSFDISLSPRVANVGLQEWWLGLGLLMLRDAIEGDLAIGWGKAKGMGAFRAAYANKASWPEVLSTLRAEHGAEAPNRWLAALHRTLDSLASSQASKQGARA